MPFMTDGKRDYSKEHQWELKHKGGQRLKDRVLRVQARRKVEKKLGHNLPASEHVDHKLELVRGGTDALSNLRVVSGHTNLEKEARRKQRASRG